MGIIFWESGKVFYSCLADLNNFHNDNFECFYYCNPVERIQSIIQQPAFSEHMSCAPAQEFNDAEKRVYSEVKSSDWWWNERVHKEKFIIPTIILTASIAMTAAWSYNCPFIQKFAQDTPYTLCR